MVKHIFLFILGSYDLQLEVIRLDFKSGLEALLGQKPTKAIFLGTRIGDPNAVLFFLTSFAVLFLGANE